MGPRKDNCAREDEQVSRCKVRVAWLQQSNVVVYLLLLREDESIRSMIDCEQAYTNDSQGI